MHAPKGDKMNFETCVNLHPMNENETSIHKMRSWVKKLDWLEKVLKMMHSKTLEKLEKLDKK